MKWNVGTKIAAAFGLALAILVAIGIISYRNTIQLTATANWVNHTHQVLQNLESLLSAVKDAETGQRGFIITGEDRYLEPYRNAQSEIEDNRKATRTLTSDNAAQQKRMDQLDTLLTTRLTELQEVITVRKSQGFDPALQIVISDRGKKTMDDLRKLVGEMEAEEESLLTSRTADAEASTKMAESSIIFGTLAAFVILGIAGLVLTRNIAGPLQDLTTLANRITVGDLSVKVATSERADEVGQLTNAFNRMSQSLRTMAGVAEQIAAGDLRATIQPQSEDDLLGNAFAKMSNNLRDQIRSLLEGANVLSSSAAEIVASTTQLASGASESATAVSETTTTVEEVRQTAQLSSEKARGVSDAAQRAAQTSQSGRKSTEDVSTGMSRIRQQMDSIGGSMVRLSEQSQTIGQIIATVEDLAAQSNLLAVNAAIEAAKAGEHGRGFNVVAQEVKSLAEQSRQATNQVRSILGEIQKATTAAVMATEQGNKAVEAGARQTELAGESIQTLNSTVSEAAQMATQIAASSQQQLVGMDQVALAMENIKQASTQNVASAKQLESAARNLSDLGQRLKKMVERYQV